MKKRDVFEKLNNETAVNFGEIFNKYVFISFDGESGESKPFLLTNKIYQDVFSKVLEIPPENARSIIEHLTFFDEFYVYDFLMSLKIHTNRIAKKDNINLGDKVVKIVIEKVYERDFIKAFIEVIDGFVNQLYCPSCVIKTTKKLFGDDTAIILQINLHSLEKKKFILFSLANRSNVNILLKNPNENIKEEELFKVVPIKLEDKVWQLLMDTLVEEYELEEEVIKIHEEYEEESLEELSEEDLEEEYGENFGEEYEEYYGEEEEDLEEEYGKEDLEEKIEKEDENIIVTEKDS